tara:strand:+ start:73273 stop:73428 length:156 start_codon:yes stop_codon:yes gene_type:complete
MFHFITNLIQDHLNDNLRMFFFNSRVKILILKINYFKFILNKKAFAKNAKA